MLKFNDFDQVLNYGDANKLMQLNTTKSQLKNIDLPSMASSIEFYLKKEIRLLTIGNFSPSDQKLGSLFSLKEDGTASLLQSSLQRPVHIASGDLTGNNTDDIVICEFGNYTGSLSLFKNGVEKQVLLNLPGARKVELKDMNGDGLLDIVAFFAQSYEQIIIFFNEGNYIFRQEQKLEFQPMYGVSYFELKDFNNDGHWDILLSNGDNWDYSAIDKFYHGVHIYLNNGENEFDEAFFNPIYGCSKAMSSDFDNDGDLDIVATSFYADLNNPSDSFIYLENKGDLTFEYSTIEEAGYGKWLTMEVADYNQDGKDDVILGSFIFNAQELVKIMQKGIDQFPQLLLLTKE